MSEGILCRIGDFHMKKISLTLEPEGSNSNITCRCNELTSVLVLFVMMTRRCNVSPA